jgi:hypothetical protein
MEASKTNKVTMDAPHVYIGRIPENLSGTPGREPALCPADGERLSTRLYPGMKQVEYDTGMPGQIDLRLRILPDGEFQRASQIGWNGRLLELDPAGGHFPLGALLEIERGAMVYLGELQRQTGSTVVVAIEHSVNRDALKPIQEAWG